VSSRGCCQGVVEPTHGKGGILRHGQQVYGASRVVTIVGQARDINYSVLPTPPVDFRPKTINVGRALAFIVAATAPGATQAQCSMRRVPK